ncbi:MAG TPA: exonuclease domain-containing protein [Cyclobacteriaceae bacterium]|nr:exonuclease domain-containing protein [Cyclobacteriaceae bacterium]
MYAIVDIETTGGLSAYNRITEVAVIVYDGYQVVEEYHSLVNPERPIPDFITGLTGINSKMLKEAPVFMEIAPRLYELLADKIFVAHNVNFDYSFLKEEFQRVGFNFNRPKLCTVRLSRQICPGLRSYSLGRVCEHIGIDLQDRHRAFGDASATAKLFSYLMSNDETSSIANALKRNSGESFLPPQISMEKYLSLPEDVGIYYFHDAHGQVIYVGKAINIKKRFKGHFTGGSKSSKSMKSDVFDVTFELTGSEFLALLLEALEIKRLWPKYNRSQKVKGSSWGIYQYEDSLGYIRLQVSKVQRMHQPMCSFSSHAEAWNYLLERIKEFGLCPKLCGIQKSPGACYAFLENKCEGACCAKETNLDYNSKVERLLLSLKDEPSRILIKEKGRECGEQAAILFDRGLLTAYGFIDKRMAYSGTEEVISSLSKVKSVPETKNILRAYLANPHAEFLEI